MFAYFARTALFGSAAIAFFAALVQAEGAGSTLTIGVTVTAFASFTYLAIATILVNDAIAANGVYETTLLL